MSEALTDGALVRRAGFGDGIAFSELVSRHYRCVLAVAVGLTGDLERAEAAADAAFAAVSRRLRGLSGASAYSIWLYRELLRACISPEARADLLAVPLGGLSLTARAALLLRDVQGLTYDEMAAVLGLSRARVASVLLASREHVGALWPPAQRGSKKAEGVP